MERFFPGERVSGVLARVAGVLLVVLIIVGVLAAVFVAGAVTVVAQALELDSEWVLTVVSAMATLVIAVGIVHGIYRVIPANPPAARSARLPAFLVGVAIAAMTLLYGLVSPWLVSGFQTFGVMASVFVALIWLRVVFLAMIYGAAMARYRDVVTAAGIVGGSEPGSYATHHAIEQEEQRAGRELEGVRDVARRGAEAAQARGATQPARRSDELD